MSEPVHIIGATGRSGLALSRALVTDAVPVVPVVRDVAKWNTTWDATWSATWDAPCDAVAGTGEGSSGGVAALAQAPRAADVRQADRLRAALQDATRIVSCAHARHAAAILEAAPPSATLVLLGSTRKFTRWPDAHGNGVLAGEDALLKSGRSAVMLHPTMIYGAQGENNVQRLAALLRRTPVLPLPGGGRFLVQPIYQDDVIRAIRAALGRSWATPSSLVIGGPDAVRYADFVRAVAAAAGLRRPLILPFPAAPLIAATRLTRHVTALPRVEGAEVRRLLEDKAVDITDMRTILGLEPMPLAEGLARTFTG